MNQFIPTTTIVAISILSVLAVGIGLQPLTYEYPEGTHLREVLPFGIITIAFLFGLLKFFAYIFKAIRMKSLQSLTVAILYLAAGTSGFISFSYSYRIMGYSMAD